MSVVHGLIVITFFSFFFQNAIQDEKRLQFTDFATLINKKTEQEKYIVIVTNKLLSFTTNGPTI